LKGGAMSLIKKPAVEDFRDSTSVRAVRGTKVVVREGGGAAARTAGKLWLSVILLAFIASGLASIGGVNTLAEVIAYAALMGGAIFLLVWLFRGASRSPETAIEDGADDCIRNVSVPLPSHLRAPLAEDGFHIDYWSRALSEKAGMFGLFGFMLVFVSSGPLLVVGILLLARCLLVLSPLFGGRACVRADGQGLTVCSLIGEKKVAWAKIDDVVLRSFPRRNIWVSFTIGSRHTIMVRGQHDFETTELLIPYPLLGLDRDGAKRLAGRITAARAQALGSPQVRPSSGTAREAAQRIAAPGSGDSAPEPFDPDKIMAHYLAEREVTIQASGMPPVHRTATFGRKRAS
jgi:hypothetical protein